MPTPSATETFSISGTDFAKKLNELHALFNQLRAEGAHTDLDLPRIVVIGNQSAGKSSLVEALTGISVPRDAGTCTRTPMECRLTHSPDTWSCQISIRREYDENGKKLLDVKEVPFGQRLTKKEDVEPMLRRAQAAVLLGDASVSDLKASVKGDRFSRNVVCVDLAGPDLTNLSFVDLPGIIQNADDHVVKLLEDLVVSYISGNSLILVTLTMSDDIQNQKAAHLARQVDPNGERTIGVLTKPDTIPSGSIEKRKQWVDILLGKEHPTKHGYFCTRQPDDAERAKRLSSADARAAEKRFFDEEETWSQLSCRERLGTENLLKTMSDLLSQMMQKSFPKVLRDVAQQLKQCDRDLSRLPRNVANEPYLSVLNVVSAFFGKVADHVYGSPTCPALVQGNNLTYEAFRRKIALSQPVFVPCESFKTPAFDLRRFFALDDLFRSAQPVYLDNIKAHAAASITRQLPHNIPYAAKESLIRAFQETWEGSVAQCFEDVQKAFQDTLTAMIELHFAQYNNLKGAVMSIVMDHLSAHIQTAETRIQDIVRAERRLLYTQNKGLLSAERAKYLHLYRDSLTDEKLVGLFAPRPAQNAAPQTESQSTPQPPQFAFGFTIGASGKPATTNYVPKDGERLLKTYEVEIDLMADVRAYFDVAFQRIIDSVPMTIDLQFLYAFCESLQDCVFEKLGLGAADAKSKCDFYLAEDPDVAAKRHALNAKKARLVKVQKAISKFGL
ncbi:transporter [Ganoderma sinense ZZ0214-1]|uniref:Transporter n=1 Tax=Ganoderma sinense ZZ0214-1 TaxID=1077348 RepID=A0A2G8RVV4_9APHY|nr:transporter [Ganoderma sinense ZZ0214-1]